MKTTHALRSLLVFAAMFVGACAVPGSLQGQPEGGIGSTQGPIWR